MNIGHTHTYRHMSADDYAVEFKKLLIARTKGRLIKFFLFISINLHNINNKVDRKTIFLMQKIFFYTNVKKY